MARLLECRHCGTFNRAGNPCRCGGPKKPDYYAAVGGINTAKAKIASIIEDAKESDPEFYEDIKRIFTAAKQDANNNNTTGDDK